MITFFCHRYRSAVFFVADRNNGDPTLRNDIESGSDDENDDDGEELDLDGEPGESFVADNDVDDSTTDG